jgi:hypothetical protein
VVSARAVLLVALGAVGCGWTLPMPDAVFEVGTVQRDVVVTSMDAVGMDAPDVTLGPPDVTVRETGSDVADVMDAGDAGDASDARDAADAAEVADVRDVVIPEGGCLPPAFRMCFTGDRMTLGSGYCREGAQFCERTNTWSTLCEGEITRDCAGRECGSDGCEGSCGSCPSGRVCDDTGRCVPPSTVCGPMNFTVLCGAGNCPANSTCVGGRCRCNANFEARHCDAVPCPTTGCDGTDWWCAPAPFCAGGAITCMAPAGSFLCPRWSLCDTMNRTCLCRPGFQARRCDGTLCTSCSGTEYECVPTRAM